MKAKILQFLLSHWREVAILLLAGVVMGKMQMDMHELQKAYETARISYQEQISGLKLIHDEEIAQRARALEEYEARVDRIEREYAENLAEVESRLSSDTRKYERDHTEAPQDLIEEIHNTFGFEYVE
jgi:hypothetical protein